MATVTVRTPARPPAPALPQGEIVLEPPPELPAVSRSNWANALAWLPMLAGAVAMALMFAGQAGGPLTYLTGGLFGLSTIGMLATQVGQSGGQRRAETRRAREAYLDHLADVRADLRADVAAQRASAQHLHPAPDRLIWLLDTARVWERRSQHEDFAVVRVGIGPQLPVRALEHPEPTEPSDWFSAAARTRLIDAHAKVEGLPIAISLRGFRRVTLTGSGAAGAARALAAQLATFHSPNDVRIAYVGPLNDPDWDWLKWLPHAQHPQEADAAGPSRLATPDHDGLALEARFPFLLIVNHPSIVSQPGEPADRPDVCHLVVDPAGTASPVDGELTLHVEADSLRQVGIPDERLLGVPDDLGLRSATALARRLAPMRPPAAMGRTG